MLTVRFSPKPPEPLTCWPALVPGLEAAEAAAAPLPMRTAPLLLRFDRLLVLRSRARSAVPPPVPVSASAAWCETCSVLAIDRRVSVGVLHVL